MADEDSRIENPGLHCVDTQDELKVECAKRFSPVREGSSADTGIIGSAEYCIQSKELVKRFSEKTANNSNNNFIKRDGVEAQEE